MYSLLSLTLQPPPLPTSLRSQAALPVAPCCFLTSGPGTLGLDIRDLLPKPLRVQDVVRLLACFLQCPWSQAGAFR